jgi:glutamine cyclotransferase
MDARIRSRFVLFGLAVGAVILVAALALTQRPPRVQDAAPAATSPLAANQSPLAVVIPAQINSPLPNATPAGALRALAAVAYTAVQCASVAITAGNRMATGGVPAESAQAAPPVYSYRVVAEYPHAPDAYTQGLQYVDGLLYEGTGLNGASSLRRVALETGEVLQSVPLSDTHFGEGIVVVDDRIVQLTWQSNVGFIYDRHSFGRVGEFRYPTEGWGITYDGEQVIMSDGTSTLYRWDAQTMAEVGRIEVTDQGVPVARLNELEMVKGEIWANIWQTNRIARIDPATGHVVGWIDLTGLLSAEDRARPVDVLNGIAYDADKDRIFVTGKWWPKLFEIEVVNPE